MVFHKLPKISRSRVFPVLHRDLGAARVSSNWGLLLNQSAFLNSPLSEKQTAPTHSIDLRFVLCHSGFVSSPLFGHFAFRVPTGLHRTRLRCTALQQNTLPYIVTSREPRHQSQPLLTHERDSSKGCADAGLSAAEDWSANSATPHTSLRCVSFAHLERERERERERAEVTTCSERCTETSARHKAKTWSSLWALSAARDDTHQNCCEIA